MAERKAHEQSKDQDPAQAPAPPVQQAAPDAGSDVQIAPTGAAGPTASQQAFGANAYATGNDASFTPGQDAATQGSGKKLLAHEATHVSQQNQGRDHE
jgi:hypothetical protein